MASTERPVSTDSAQIQEQNPGDADDGVRWYKKPTTWSSSVTRAEPELGRSYTVGETVKRYDESPARKVMDELVADPEKTRRLAGFVLDKLAREKLINRGEGSDPHPLEAYRRALAECREKYPGLARAAVDGFISDTDFKLLGMLVPAVAAEVEKGNYRERCSHCGERTEYCRGRKLARQRNVDEESRAFEKCILDARRYGNELDAVSCYY